MNLNRVSKLSKLVTNNLKRKPTVVLEPNCKQSLRMYGTAEDVCINIDVDDWKVPGQLKDFIINLAKSNCSSEVKIIKIYQKLCEDYTYDDNVLSYIRKNDDDTFFIPDSYGRFTDASWKAKRQQHNRRNCFEISRILAKSICTVLKLSNETSLYDVCILWDEAVTHYFVGLVCKDYCLSLDLDDFTQIKDLTRVKTGLTIEGIRILDDPYDKFGEALAKYNYDKCKIAREQIDKNVDSSNDVSDDIQFLKYAVQFLKDEYNLDSAGMFEYLKEIVDTKIGASSRKKVWTEVENNPGMGKRYTRCLLVTVDDVQYLIDCTKDNPEEVIRKFDIRELDNSCTKMIPFNNMMRDWDEDPYDGR